MDNFNLKQYLVENKLTYQEKMKDKAKSMKEAETTSKPKEQEKGHQAPKDKQKQGPSSINEVEQSKIEKYIGYLESYENAITQLQRADADYIEREIDREFGSDKEIHNKAKELCKTAQDQKMKDKCKRAKLLEIKTLNEGKVFFGGY